MLRERQLLGLAKTDLLYSTLRLDKWQLGFKHSKTSSNGKNAMAFNSYSLWSFFLLVRRMLSTTLSHMTFRSLRHSFWKWEMLVESDRSANKPESVGVVSSTSFEGLKNKFYGQVFPFFPNKSNWLQSKPFDCDWFLSQKAIDSNVAKPLGKWGSHPAELQTWPAGTKTICVEYRRKRTRDTKRASFGVLKRRDPGISPKSYPILEPLKKKKFLWGSQIMTWEKPSSRWLLAELNSHRRAGTSYDASLRPRRAKAPGGAQRFPTWHQPGTLLGGSGSKAKVPNIGDGSLPILRYSILKSWAGGALRFKLGFDPWPLFLQKTSLFCQPSLPPTNDFTNPVGKTDSKSHRLLNWGFWWLLQRLRWVGPASNFFKELGFQGHPLSSPNHPVSKSVNRAFTFSWWRERLLQYPWRPATVAKRSVFHRSLALGNGESHKLPLRQFGRFECSSCCCAK